MFLGDWGWASPSPLHLPGDCFTECSETWDLEPLSDSSHFAGCAVLGTPVIPGSGTLRAPWPLTSWG